MEILLEPLHCLQGRLSVKDERLLSEFERTLGEEEGWAILGWESGFEGEEGRE